MNDNDHFQVNVGGDVTDSIVVVGRLVHVDHQPAPGTRVENDDLNPAEILAFPDMTQLQVLAALRSKFGMEDIELVSWELGIRFDDLSGSTLTAKALDLVRRAAFLGLVDKLATIVQRERPDMPTAA